MTHTAIESIEALDFDYAPPCEYNSENSGCLSKAPADVITTCKYCACQLLICNECLEVFMMLVEMAGGFSCKCGPHLGDLTPFYITPLK